MGDQRLTGARWRWRRARSSRQCPPPADHGPACPYDRGTVVVAPPRARPTSTLAAVAELRVRLLGGPRRRGPAGARGREPQGADAPRRAGGRPGRAARRGRARRGAVGRRPAGQAGRAGRGAGQPACGARSAPIGSRGTTPATRSSPTGSTSASSRRAWPPPSARWPPATRSRPGWPPRWPSTSPAVRSCPRRARRGSTARGRRWSGRSPPPACSPPRRPSCRVTRRGPSRSAARGLDHDPYDEAALRSLMRAHAALGRPASALAAYAEVRARLAEDLGVSPAAETEALHSEILLAGPNRRRWPRRRPRPGALGPARAARPVRSWPPRTSTRLDETQAKRCVAAPGASALELAGWVAYYDRDFPSALRLAEEAARTAGDDERRTSALDAVRTGPALARRPGRRRARPRGRGAEHGRRRPGHRRGVAEQPAHAPGPVRRGDRAVGAGRGRRRRPAPPVRHPARDVGPHLRAGRAGSRRRRPSTRWRRST